MAWGHGRRLLLPSSESQKLTLKVTTNGQTGLVQGWYHPWYAVLYCRADPSRWKHPGVP